MQLFEFIRHVQQTNIPEWNYYRADISIDPLIFPERSLDFIREYFQNGQKGYAIVDLEDCRNILWRNGRNDNIYRVPPLHLSEFRAVHTVSTFFLGILLEHYIAQEIGHTEISVGKETFPFSYLWFLTCLYHDWGYIVEENWTPQLEAHRDEVPCTHRVKAPSDLAILKRQLRIMYSPYRQNIDQQWGASYRNRFSSLNCSMYDTLLMCNPTLRTGVRFGDGKSSSQFTYSSNLVQDYFSYCIHELSQPIYNHGIIGGYLFYDRMINNYIYAYKKSHLRNTREAGFYPGIANFYWNGKHFCAEQLPLFAYIADCIIAHNIWKADSKSEKKYLEYGLTELVGKNFRQISFRSNPLLFILAITDTLDPYKIYGSDTAGGKDAPQVWRSFDFSFEQGTLTVSSRYKCRPIQKLYNKAKSLKVWTNVKNVYHCDEKSFSIKII